MPQKYRISMRGVTSDRLLTGYFFSAHVIHSDWGGTNDGRFYSKKAAIDCLLHCYQHYLSRYEEGLSSVKPMFTGEILFIDSAFFYIEKA